MKPFWEDAYRRNEGDTFGPRADEIAALAPRLSPGARVLDIGCGEGRNALHLARHGTAVHAFDVSHAGIATMQRAARKEGLALACWVQDVASFHFPGAYDLIVCHGVLHLVERGTGLTVLRAMQAHTRPGGWNVVAVFTDGAPIPADLVPHVKGIFKTGELFRCYGDGWEHEMARSYLLEDEHPGGIRHRHAIDLLVARRAMGVPG